MIYIQSLGHYESWTSLFFLKVFLCTFVLFKMLSLHYRSVYVRNLSRVRYPSSRLFLAMLSGVVCHELRFSSRKASSRLKRVHFAVFLYFLSDSQRMRIFLATKIGLILLRLLQLL